MRDERVKRALDVVLCLLALPAALVVIGLCVVMIRLDSPGPVFFVQSRTGKGGKRFRMYKLRTMFRNSDELKDKYMHLNELAWPDFKITNDPRMTHAGRFLRKTSLDELPQLFNVLKGDMSLVGPRPPLPYEAEKYQSWHLRRVLEVKPGITGLWQVTGRSSTTFDEMVRLDLRYARKVSIWTDIKILLATPRAVIMGRGAC
jgi:lipopolysaccharide/colanic/teichoic acid biosynthesis glycosyltransferase